MKIAFFGAAGKIGRAIASEALQRGHSITAAMRGSGGFAIDHPALERVSGDVQDPESVARISAGHDAVASAVGPLRLSDGALQDVEVVVRAAKSLVEGLERSGVRRLVVVGGAGSLLSPLGGLVLDSLDFPAIWKPVAQAHFEALEIYRSSQLDWTFFAPAALITPGERTGRFITGSAKLLTNTKGESRISYEDYAVAFVNELEKNQFVHQVMTAAGL